MKQLLTVWLAFGLLLLSAPFASAGPYEEGLKIVNDPHQLATRMADARAKFAEATRKDATNAYAWYNLGLLAYMANDVMQAREAWRSAQKADPEYLPAQARLAQLEYERGDKAEGKAQLERIIVDNRYQAEARNMLAGIAIEAKDWDAAIKHSRNVLLGDPENVNAYANLAMVYYRQGLVDQAWLIATNALERVPDAAALRNILGLIYLKRDDSRQAATEFLKALAADPRQMDAKLNLAAMELAFGAFEQSLKRFDEVLETRPDDAMVIVSRAVALRGLERFEEAQQGYEKALALSPGLPAALYNLCVLHQQYTNQYALAQRFCQEYQSKFDKAHPKYKEMAKRLRSIEATIEALTPEPSDQPGGAGDDGSGAGGTVEGGSEGGGSDEGGGEAGGEAEGAGSGDGTAPADGADTAEPPPTK